MLVPQIEGVKILDRSDLNDDYFISDGRGIALTSAKIGSKEAECFNFLNSKIY